MTMFRPSSRPSVSIVADPSICSAIRSRIRLPRSGWTTSRPLNMTVTLTLWPSFRNLSTLSSLGVEVSGPDLRPVLHLLDPDVARLPPRLLGPLRLVEFEFPVVHDPADGRIRQRRHLHQVEILLLGNGERLWKRRDPELATFSVDKPDLTSTDTVVDPWLIGAGNSGDWASSSRWGRDDARPYETGRRRCRLSHTLDPAHVSARADSGRVGVAPLAHPASLSCHHVI